MALQLISRVNLYTRVGRSAAVYGLTDRYQRVCAGVSCSQNTGSRNSSSTAEWSYRTSRIVLATGVVLLGSAGKHHSICLIFRRYVAMCFMVYFV